MNGYTPQDLPARTDPTWTIAVVASQWHREILQPMIDCAIDTLVAAGIPATNISLHDAPGSFEVPLIGSMLIEKVDAVIGLGIVLQGETHHAEAIVSACASAMMDLQVRHKKPFAFEILHVHTLEQARQRAEGPKNKGFEAACAVLHALATLHEIDSHPPRR